VVAPNADTFVRDGHGANTHDRVVKLDKTGKQIATWPHRVIESRRNLELLRSDRSRVLAIATGHILTARRRFRALRTWQDLPACVW